MIHLTERIWAGGSNSLNNITAINAKGLLNVARDLPPPIFHNLDEIDYMQIGLVDGPGNEINTYCAAVLALLTLARRHETVLIYDHEGSRALVVVMMYLNIIEGKRRKNPTAWSHWPTWEARLTDVRDIAQLEIPEPHEAHKEAFANMPFGLLEAML